MIGGLGVGELSIILVIVVILFGAGRLAGIGSGLGRGIKNFRKELGTDAKKKDAEAKQEIEMKKKDALDDGEEDDDTPA